MSGRRAVITGMGAVTPYGIGVDTFWENIAEGNTGASLITSFDVSELPTRFAAQVPLADSDFDSFIENKKSLKTLSRSGKMAVISANEAVQRSGLIISALNPYRVGTSLGASGVGNWDLAHSEQIIEIAADSVKRTNGKPVEHSRFWRTTLEQVHPLSPLQSLSNIPTAQIAITHNARGNCQTITTACTSSAQAIGEAYRQIKFDIADVVIAGGSDSMVNPNGIVAFSMLGVMTRNNEEYLTAARPFDRRRSGFMLGEGATMFVLEELDHCKRRGAEPYAEVIGYASTCDAYRLTDEPPDASGSIEAMKRALVDAEIALNAVDYINAHGTGTVMNDKTETFAIKAVFGDEAYSIPVSSTKSMIGHLVAAAGAAELAACVLAMKHQVIPPTINYQERDPQCDLDYVPNSARDATLNVILSNSFGFGGQNACLLIRRPS